MVDETSESIVDRLKQEGQLIRNTGTNSIKAVRTELARFNDIFISINDNLIQQTQILRETLQLQLVQADRAERAQQLNEVRRTEPIPIPPRRDDIIRGGGGDGDVGLASIFQAGTIGGGLGAGLMGILGALKSPIRTALLALIAPSVGALLGGLTESALNELGADPRMASDFGEAAKLGGLFGMIGLAFGRRMGLIGAGAGVAASFGDEVLDALGLDKDKMISLFGQEMRLETAAQGLLGAIGASVTGVMTSPAFRNSLVNFFKGVDTQGITRGNLATRRILGATIGTAVLGAYITYGDDLKKWIEEQEFPEPIEGVFTAGTDIAGMAATGASFGMMFGPKGALVGASLGAAIGIGMTLFNWINERKARNEARIQEEINEMNRILDDAEERGRVDRLAQDLSTMTPEEQAAATSTLSGGEMRALNELITPIQELTEELTYLRAESKTFEQLGQVSPFADKIEETQGRLIDLLNEQYNLLENKRDEMELRYGPSARSTPEYSSLITDLDNIWAKLQPLIQESPYGIPSLNTGTRGFQDFGRGSFAVLHGREAVVPEMTPAGQFLKTYFDENWQPVLNKIGEVSSAASRQLGGAVTYAPVTIAPVTNSSVRGGTSSTVVNTVGGGRSDLDALSSPWAH
jgi:hypothetical protein